MRQKAIEIENLSFSYERTEVLKNVSLTINQGDFVALIGANGSGKSTLMKLMLGLEKPKKGVVKLFGSDVQELLNYEALGYVSQGGLGNVSAFPATVMEVILLRMKPTSFFSFSNKARKDEALKALRHVGMEDYADSLIGNLSGGQLQRVLIARELMMNPEIIFLDEPTSGLDKASIQTLYELLDHINDVHKITIIMVTHNIGKDDCLVNRVFEVFDHDVKEISNV